MCVATLAIAGSVIGAAGSVAGGIAQANNAHYQAQVAANNALIQKQNAAYAASAAASNTEQSGLQERAQLASVRAAEAANGLDVNTGSAADVQDTQHRIGDLNTRTVSNNGALQVYGYQAQSVNDSAQSAADEAQVGSDMFQGIAGGIGKLASNPSVTSALGGGGNTLAMPDIDSDLSDTQSYIDGQGSLLSGDPSVPPMYQWMQGTGASGGMAA